MMFKNTFLRRLLIGLSILGSFILISVIIVGAGPKNNPTVPEEKAWPVSIMTVSPQCLSPTLVVYGKVESNQVANLQASVNATVADVLTREGEQVEKGQVLIQLDKSELNLAANISKAELRQQLARLQSVKTEQTLEMNITPHHREMKDISDANLKRHLELYDKGIIPDSLLDKIKEQAVERAIILEKHLARIKDFPNLIIQQEARVLAAETKLAKAKLDLAQTAIKAPFKGRVIQTLVSPGDRALPISPLIRIAGYSGLEIRATIPAKSGNVLKNQLYQEERILAVGMLDNQSIELYLDRLSADVKSGQTGLDGFFKTRSGEPLDIGRVIHMTVVLPVEKDTVALPIQSVYEGNRIYRVDNRRLVAVNIEPIGDLIKPDGSFCVLVRSPELHEGDRIITTQLPSAITGLLVEPIEPSKLSNKT